MLKDDWGRTHIRLYITSNDGKTFCLNEHLVDKDYATKGVPLDAGINLMYFFTFFEMLILYFYLKRRVSH